MSTWHAVVAGCLRNLDPETAHRLTIAALKLGLGPRDHGPADPALATHIAGVRLSNPIGVAAGFDKNAEAPGAMVDAGFGFIECGTVTPAPQAGNPRPRLFRLSADRAVINRMGFNNRGLEAFAASLAARRAGLVVGANIGANKDSVDRPGDYVKGLKRLWGLCDYFTINVSSPNTPGLRDLQGGAALDDLLGRVNEARRQLPQPRQTPVLLKLAPDLDDSRVEAIVAAVLRHDVQGLVIANTTLARPTDLRSRHRAQPGGLSGRPLMGPATRLLALFHEAALGKLALVGVGGIASGADAYAKIRAGACAVQLYTALVFTGPNLVRRMRSDLSALLRADGFSQLGEAVGAR
ncbi:MAG TPA: quinone-dependent dihydroorotate dehydrogenase [Caulobacteraceae bacterium]